MFICRGRCAEQVVGWVYSGWGYDRQVESQGNGWCTQERDHSVNIEHMSGEEEKKLYERSEEK